MQRITRIQHHLLLVILWVATGCIMPLFTSCSSCGRDDVLLPEGVDDEEKEIIVGKYLTLVLNPSDDRTVSRGSGDPNGGENGDGRDKTYKYTLDNERHISDAVMLLYKSEAGINSNTAEVQHALDFTQFHLENGVWKSETVRADNVIDMGKTYHVIVIANIGGLSNLGFDPRGMSISELRNKIYKGDLKRSVSCRNASNTADETHDHLVMTSYNDDRVTFLAAGGSLMNGGAAVNGGTTNDGEGTKDSPYVVGDITVERLAARLDILPGQYKEVDDDDNEVTRNIEYNATQGGYIYNVYALDDLGNASNDTLDRYRFVLQSIEVRNIPTYGSYFLRRTMMYDGEDFSAPSYFGKDNNGSSSTVWMIDPQTTAQREACDTYKDDYANYKTAFTDKYTSWSLTLNASGASAEREDGDGRKYILVRYLPENTFINHDGDGVSYDLNFQQCYATKIHFKGLFYDKNNTATTTNEYGKPDAAVWVGGQQKTYEYTIRHNDPSGAGKPEQKMLNAIVRNNLYRIEIAKVINTNLSSVILGVWYFRNGQNGTYSLVNVPSVNIYEDVGEDTGGADKGTGADNYPNDAPRRRR